MREKTYVVKEDYFSFDYHNSLFLVTISLFGFMALNLVSYKFQKDFSNLNRPSKLMIFFLATFIFILLTFIVLIFSNILYLNNGETSNKELFFKNEINSTALSTKALINFQKNRKENNYNYNQFLNETSQNINLVLALLNFFFYIILPLVIIYLIEDKNINEVNNNYNSDDTEILNAEHSEINSVQYPPCEMDYMNIIKNFSFYITALISLNLVYLILFKTSILSSSNVLEFYTFVPEILRNYSTYISDYETLLYLNFFCILIIGKFSLLIYLPFGFGKLSAMLIDNLKKSQELKIEFNNLNSGFNKNFEVIKQITTQKLMTGKNLSKKERNILRQCKENQTLLEHKQEILEEKYSKIEVFIYYVSFPIKFFTVILTILIGLLFVISKIFALYANFKFSECGAYCGYFTDKTFSSIGIQDIYAYLLMHYDKIFYFKNTNFVVFLMSLFYLYVVLNILISLKNLGLINFSKIISFDTLKLKFNFLRTSDIRSDKIRSILLYSVFFVMSIVASFEVLSLNPGISFYMQNFMKCDLKIIDKEVCKFSAYMIVNMKNSVNFPLGVIVALCFEILITLFTGIFIIYLPLKSLANFFNCKQEASIEDEENMIKC